MYTLIASTAILRSVTGVVLTAIAKSLEGYCEIASIASGGRFKPAQKWEGQYFDDAFRDIQS